MIENENKIINLSFSFSRFTILIMESDKEYLPIRTPQRLMAILGYPDEVECPFGELFSQREWCGWWVEDGNILEIGMTGETLSSRAQIIFKDHTKRDFYDHEILDSGLCEDYGIEEITLDGNKRVHKFIPHTQVIEYQADTYYALYRLKMYVPLIKSSNKTT